MTTTLALAAAWCALNGYRWPEGWPEPEGGVTDEDRRRAFRALNSIAGPEGLMLWRCRFDDGLNPATGESRPDREAWLETHREVLQRLRQRDDLQDG